MNELLLINGKKVTLKPGSIRRNLQINDIAEVKDRQANYSNTIDLPKTPNNIAVFDFLGVPGNNSLKPFRKIRADYYVNGIPQVTNGTAVVKESDEDVFKLVIYDGITDLQELIKGKKLSDLNFADLNHHLTTATFAASMQEDSGYIYALGNFGVKQYTSGIKVEYQAPSVFISTIWDKIFAEAGRAYVGDFFLTNEDFKTEVITPSKGYDVQDVPLTTTALGTVGTELLNDFQRSPNYIMKSYDWNFDSGSASQLSIVGGKLQANFSGVLVLVFDIDYNCGQTTYLSLSTRLNGSAVNWQRFDYLKDNLTFQLTLNVQSGDQIELKVDASDTGYYNQETEINDPKPIGGEDTIDERYEINFSMDANVTAKQESGGQFIDLALMFSDMTQQEFIKDVMQRFGLIMKPLRNSNAYEFIQFEDLLNKKETAEDWSDKLSALGPEEFGIDYARENLASYQYPEEITDRSFDGVLVVDNENAPSEKPLFQSPYEVATKSHKSSGVQLYNVPIWAKETEEGVEVRKLKQTPAKLFRIQRGPGPVSAKLFDETNSTSIETPAFLSQNNISLQYYIGNYYKAFGNLVSRPKKRSALFKFTELDIYDLDFFRLKYLRQTGRFYYLNTLSNAPGKLSEAKLIQITQFSENLAPTVLGVYSVTMSYKSSRTITVNQLTNYTDPLYFDPEFDPAYSVLFTGGFNSDVLLKNKDGVIINTATEILATDFPVTLEDQGTSTAERTAALTFKIKDEGSKEFSTVEGTVDITVRAYTNNPPTANAGEDQTIYIDADSGDPAKLVGLFGDGSTDNTGEIISWEWIILNGPAGYTAAIDDFDTGTANAALNLPQTSENLGTFEIQLTVTDEFGASDTDNVNINVNLDIKP